MGSLLRGSIQFACAWIVVFGVCGQASAAYVLISDVDDTIKVSHVSKPVSFAGMATLYSNMMSEAKARSNNSSFVVLSGAPQLFESSLWDFLEVGKFPEPLRLTSRPMLYNTEEYKTDAVTTLLADVRLADATVVLVGDDVESDFAAYQNSINATTFGPKTASRQTQIYLRRVSGAASTLVKTVLHALAFDSAADIAISEFAHRRLSRAAVEEVFAEVETETDVQRLFVAESYCPGARSVRYSSKLKPDDVPADLLQRFVRLEDRLREVCATRNQTGRN